MSFRTTLLRCFSRKARLNIWIYITIIFITATIIFVHVFSDVSSTLPFSKGSILPQGKVNSSTYLSHYNSIDFTSSNEFLFCRNITSSYKTTKEENKLLVIIVPSARLNFFRRETIRKTWGSKQNFNGFNVQIIFVLGQNAEDSLQNQIQQEMDTRGDMVVFNFVDTYRFLTYKTLLSFKWVLENCAEASFILKADDDVFIDIFQLLQYMSSLRAKNLILCHVNKQILPQRNNTEDRWFVAKEEYSEDVYPDYCLGTAYLITVDIAKALFEFSLVLAPEEIFWIEDVFITGILREHLIRNNIAFPELLSLSRSYNIVFIHEWKFWYKTAKKGTRLPWIFIQTWEESQYEFENDFINLWNRSLEFQNFSLKKTE